MEVDLESSLPLTDSDCSVNTRQTHCSVPEATVSRRAVTRVRSVSEVYRCARHILTNTYCMCVLESVSSWQYTKHQDLLKGNFTQITKEYLFSHLSLAVLTFQIVLELFAPASEVYQISAATKIKGGKWNFIGGAKTLKDLL